MASILLRTAGSAVGNALLPGIGGAFLGTLGRGVGGLIDGQLGLGGQAEGPRLENLGVQDSRYGAGIPLVYGRARVAGNVIWSTDLIESQHNSSFAGGKGGLGGSSTSTTTYSYSVHCAVGIALGPIGGINTIWADSTVIYQDGVWASGVIDSASFYTGSTTQTPDAFMQSILGSGNVPAYRGLAYIVLDNLQLANFGNRLPNLTFEIIPVPAAINPSWLGEVDVQIDQHWQTAQSGGMLPITLDGSATEVRTIVVGGYQSSASDFIFELVEYDVTNQKPVELGRYQSASFAATDPFDSSWALAPDGRTVALYLQTNGAPSHYLAIYDVITRQFGAVYAVNLAAGSTVTKQVAWIDPQHFIIDDIDSGARGLHVFTRAGMNVVDLGFYDVWGAGSASTRSTLYYAQYTPFAGGLLNYMSDNTVGTWFSAIYVRPIVWQNNNLTVGGEYILVSGLSTGNGSGPHANLVRTGDNEYTLCFGTVVDYHMLSFEPGLTSGTITRAWTDFTPSFTGGTQFPVAFGDRVLIVQASVFTSHYCVSEVLLNSGSFSLAANGAVVANTAFILADFSAMKLDSERLLLMAVGGAMYNIGQLGIFQRADTGDSLMHITGDILARAGYAGGDYDITQLANIDVAGYVLPGPATARAAIEPLQVYTPFDLVESADQLKAVLRGSVTSAVVPSSEWRASPDGKEPPPPLDITRSQELDLPLEIALDYIDASRDFEVNSQRARRIVTSAQSVQKIALPIVCDSTLAKQIAETRLYTMWAERELVRVRISRRWLTLDPGDVIDLDNGNLLRVTKISQAGGLMELEGFYLNASAYVSAAAADTGVTIDHPPITPVNSTLYMLDMPLLQASDDQPGVYAAATGLPGWTGASLWRAADGVNYGNVAKLPAMATAGIAVNVLGDASGCYMDRASSVNVQLINGTLSSCSETDLYNGANAALLGNEIIQFQTATLVGPGFYTLSNLLRGRRGTESATATHVTGENFILLQAGAVEFIPALLTDRGRSYDFRALSKGQVLGDATDNVFAYSLATIQPFAPVNVQGTRSSGTGSDLTLVWKRRARVNADWVDYIDVPLDETSELYDVDIMNGSSVIRTFASLTAPNVTYTAAQQSADWGTVPSSFTVNVYQISGRYGRGNAQSATV